MLYIISICLGVTARRHRKLCVVPKATTRAQATSTPSPWAASPSRRSTRRRRAWPTVPTTAVRATSTRPVAPDRWNTVPKATTRAPATSTEVREMNTRAEAAVAEYTGVHRTATRGRRKSTPTQKKTTTAACTEVLKLNISGLGQVRMRQITMCTRRLSWAH